jgi:hypothetical protein
LNSAADGGADEMKRNPPYSTFNSQRRGIVRPGLTGNPKCGLGILFLAVTLSLRSQITNAPGTDAPVQLLPPYGELPPTFWEQHGTSVAAGVIVIIVLAAWGFWRVRRIRPETVIPPEAQARQALERLRTRSEDGAVLSEVSRIVRNYFVAAFQLPPGEFTTAEFNRAMAGHKYIAPELADAATRFLRHCDERKFSPTPEPAPPGAANQALELIGLGESRLAQLRGSAPVQGKSENPARA